MTQPFDAHLLDLITESHNQHHAPLAALRIAAYAADAMRVLGMLERHAALAPDFATALQQACPDWLSPGAIDDPADLIADTLAHAIPALRDIFQGLHDAIPRPGHPAPES